ncbi:3-oxoacyl-[acyl-carrier protein] reductase [Patulibacter medicamentivorans]|uniref:3-oxoacyl-[acyl-carrier protein] reductase n=1 Tax=Patulibacter medicamentivorans TaxID=1097667 RepID=H0E8U7_9ACTN|nr:SDR family oxidoreductase [Patulibacter medicamentivorans]EHN09902.1 3-oxoacyl-[acyl-carrier protein] reductase [Patulibacter medicamentivorans]
MAYLVTGATGFIGRHLVATLLENREGDIHVVVRDGSRPKLDRLIAGWPEDAADRVKLVVGDLESPAMGVDHEWIEAHRGQIDHLFHLAAIYDMTADEERNETLNVEGTRHAVELANVLEVGCLHHVSSVAAAGDFHGVFREDMFDEGQPLPSAYHRTKFESERIARGESLVPWRVYRPAIVVGHSETGEMDKIDGPYYVFGLLKRMRKLPGVIPLAAPDLGATNMVPVDYVVKAMDHIAHEPDLDQQAFHLCNPRPQPLIDSINIFARAARAPRLSLRPPGIPALDLHKGLLSRVVNSPTLAPVRRALLAPTGIPDEVLPHMSFASVFDARRAEQALAGSGITVPRLRDYAATLWDFWERNLDPDLHDDTALRAAVHGRTVLITGASSGIGEATALKVALSGGTPLLVARTRSKLEALQRLIEQQGGTAYVYPCDLNDLEAIDELARTVTREHRVDVVVNNAGRSIRRSLKLSLNRFHDFERTMQLNYFGAIRLVMGVLPHMVEHGGGHVVNISSIGAQTWPPRFSAYVASKAALDAWTRVVASELVGAKVTFTTIHMPLVRTPMIAPTKIYDKMPTITPVEAADLVAKAIIQHPKHIDTLLGTAGEVLYALAPKISDQILNTGYRVFPDSAAARGQENPDERAGVEMRVLAALTRGMHW